MRPNSQCKVVKKEQKKLCVVRVSADDHKGTKEGSMEEREGRMLGNKRVGCCLFNSDF